MFLKIRNKFGQIIIALICLGTNSLCGQTDTIFIPYEACYLSIAQLIGAETANRTAEENSEVLIAFQLSEGEGITGYNFYGFQNADYGARYLETTLRSILSSELSDCKLNEELILLPIWLRKDDIGYQSLSCV